MGEAMKTDLVSAFDNFMRDLRVSLHFLSNKEKSRRNVFPPKYLQDVAGILGMWPVIKGEGDLLMVRPPTPNNLSEEGRTKRKGSIETKEDRQQNNEEKDNEVQHG